MIALVIGGSVLLAVAILVVVLVLARGYIRKLRARGQAELDRRFAAGEVLRAETLALCFGQQSKGKAQLRGSGALALTARELYFVMYVPERETRIPLAAIRATSLPRSHLGKTQGVELLHVRYEVDGGEDAIAWRVPDAVAWRAAVDAAVAAARAA